MLRLSIIILNYKTKDLTLNCLGSIFKQYGKRIADKEYEVIVVDNASFDGSIERVRLEFGKKLLIVENKKNYGFAKGCNMGAKSARGKYLLFLNSDTQILDRGFSKMIDFLEKNPKIAILGGKLENNDESPQPSAGKFYSLFNLLIMLLGLERVGFLRSSPNKIKRVDWVSGACMMVRKDVFEKLKGFDENFFMYIEDMELCFRAKKSGALTFVFPDIKLVHKSFGSSNRSFATINIYKGLLYFYKKHKSRLEYKIARLMLEMKAQFVIFIGSILQKSVLVETYRKAVIF